MKVVAYLLEKKDSNEQLGFICPVAKIDEKNQLTIIKDSDELSRIFVTGGYPELKRKHSGKLFEIDYEKNTKSEQNTNGDHTAYITRPSFVNQSKSFCFEDRLFEVVQVDSLPDKNDFYLNIDEFPLTKYVVIRLNDKGNGAYCFGPFLWKKNENNSILLSRSNLNFSVNFRPLFVYKFFWAKSDYIDVNERIFLIGNQAIKESSNQYLCASDEEVVECAINNILDKSNVAKYYGYFLNMFEIKSKIEPDEFDKRLEAIINNDASIYLKILSALFSCNELVFIDEYLKKNAGSSLVKEEELNKVKEYLEEEKKKNIKLQEDCDTLNSLLEENQSVAINSPAPSFDAINHEIVSQFQNVLELAKRESDFSDGVRKKEQELAELDEKIASAKLEFQSIKSELEKNEFALRDKLIKIGVYSNALNNMVLKKSEPSTVCVDDVVVNFVESSIDYNQQQVVDLIYAGLIEKNRKLSKEGVLNILISIQQSFIVFFAGVPGVGKTSLVHLLAHSMGIEKRLHTISVARGWTSLKDILGYYNPLTEKFQSSGTGLNDFLCKIIDSNNNQIDLSAMVYVLLDEANLSPMEHYWSNFMGMADSGFSRVLRKGGGEEISIPDNLRFVATINYDGTTEPLSPRIIDRAPIILLENESEDGLENINCNALDGALPFSLLNNIFGNEDGVPPDLSNEEKIVFSEIYNCLRKHDIKQGYAISISKRKENAIKQYCHKARNLMTELSKNNLRALDYAVMQHILPQVRGHGAGFGERLKGLKNIFQNNGLQLSSKLLDKMIDYGESDLHSYDFFCWQ